MLINLDDIDSDEELMHSVFDHDQNEIRTGNFQTKKITFD